MAYRNTFLLFSAVQVFGSAAVASASTVPPRAHELNESYSFDQYLVHFHKSYNDPDEYARRSQIFARNLDKILGHNLDRLTKDGEIIGGGYVMGVNAYTDFYVEELPMGYNKHARMSSTPQLVGGAVLESERKLEETQSYSKPPSFNMDDVSTLPAEIDWHKEGKVSPAPQQGGCGSCWTFASTAAIESHLAITTGDDPIPLSEQNILECAPNPFQCGGTGKCSGSTAELAFNYIADVTAKKQGGMYTTAVVAYHPQSSTWEKCTELALGKTPAAGIDGWSVLPGNDYKATMNAVAKVGPLAIAVSAGNWGFYEKGIFDDEGQEAVVNHSVLLVGYGVDEVTGEKYYKIRNSWGTRFGENGYIRIKRTDEDDQRCKMDNRPLVGTACALDANGHIVVPKPDKVCGAAGVLFDASYPVGVHYLNK